MKRNTFPCQNPSKCTSASHSIHTKARCLKTSDGHLLSAVELAGDDESNYFDANAAMRHKSTKQFMIDQVIGCIEGSKMTSSDEFRRMFWSEQHKGYLFAGYLFRSEVSMNKVHKQMSKVILPVVSRMTDARGNSLYHHLSSDVLQRTVAQNVDFVNGPYYLGPSSWQ